MNIKKELCKAGTDGKCQIKVRIDITRTNRPRLKTGIYIRPELWDEENENIKAPRKSRSNLNLHEEAKTAAEQLQEYCLRVTKIVKAGNGLMEEVSKEWLERVLNLFKAGYLTKLDSYADIQTAEAVLAAGRQSKSGCKVTTSSITEAIHVEAGGENLSFILKSYERTDFYQVILLYCECRHLAATRVSVYMVLARHLRVPVPRRVSCRRPA